MRLTFIALTCCFALYGHCWASEPRAVLNFEFRYRSPVTRVEINEVAIPLMLDLGGGSAVSLTQEELLLVNPTFTGESRTYGFIDGETHKSRLFILDHVKLGGLDLSNVTGHELHLASFSPKDSPGHIGFGVLGNYQLVVDYGQQRISLFDPDGRSVTVEYCEKRSITKLDILDNTVRSSVSFGGNENYLFAWDTGASHNIVNEELFSGSELPDLIIGGESYGATPVKQMSINDVVPFDGILGFDFLINHIVCFDFARGLVSIRRPNKTDFPR